MKIKGKLFLGLGALFVFILLITVLSVFYINKLSGDTKNILVANYNSVAYSREMLLALDKNLSDTQTAKKFEDNLEMQQGNVTETGEKQITEKLSADYQQLKLSATDSLNKVIRKDLSDVMMLNMEAIQRKSDFAAKTADNAITWISIVGTLCFIIALTLLFNLPGSIANPIRELTESIKSIAAKNYAERVHFNRYDEFGEMANAFNTMAEKLQEYNNSNIANLMTEKKRIETLINNIHEPVIGLDQNRNIIFINDEALQITHTNRENIIGKPAQDVAVNNDLIRMLIKELFELAKPNEPLKIYADGKESYFQNQVIPIDILPTGEKEKTHIGDVIFLKNITSYKELDYAKTNFIATVSHELKTPISSIKMSTQLLQNTDVGILNEEQKNLVDSIKDDALRLLKITGELLNMTQLESGKIVLKKIQTSPKDLIQRAIDNNKIAAEAKKVEIQQSISEGLPDILVDADKTVWVISNLISNAIRYSYEFSKVNIDAYRKNDKIIISVKDTGQGIAPQYIEKLFSRYFRVPGSKKEGTGLGLAISKELIEQQGGTIEVTSEFGAGSVFSISAPIK